MNSRKFSIRSFTARPSFVIVALCTGLLGPAMVVWSNQPSELSSVDRKGSQPVVTALPLVSPETKLHRRPVAVVAIGAHRAVVANRRSGTLSFVNTETLQVDSEYQLGGHPTDVVRSGQSLLITEREGRLSAVQVNDDQPRLQWQVAMPDEPATVRVSSEGEWCSVCSTWARRVTFVSMPKTNEQSPEVLKTVELPFSPREQLLLPEQARLLVADAFGTRVAVIRLDNFQVESIREIPGNNIRGLTLGRDGENVYVTHELINEIAPPRSSEIIWGSMVSDATREISIQSIVDPEASLMSGSRFIAVGNNTRGAGDPNAALMRQDGRLLVTIGGLGQLGVVEPGGIGVTRIATGKRPVAIAEVSADRFLIANELSDTLTRVDFHADASVVRKQLNERGETKQNETPQSESKPYDKEEYSSSKYEAESYRTEDYDTRDYDLDSDDDGESEDADYETQSYRASDDPEAEPIRPVRKIASYQIGPDATNEIEALFATATTLSLGISPELEPADRGEALFFDASLSRGGWYSCHSCHTDGHTSGSLADTLSDGGEGAPKRVLSLRGVGQTGPWAWIGDKSVIDEQVKQTLRLTMQGRRLNDRDVSDLVAFLKSIPPPPVFDPSDSEADRLLLEEGRHLFETLDCVACHSGHVFTSDATYDVGLDDERGTKEFNPPSLRGVGHLNGLFHDLRATSLEDVVGEFRHQLPRDLSEEEQTQLIRYLRSL
ncbi:cytochrome c peroxidase [Rhodopirellula baltica]